MSAVLDQLAVPVIQAPMAGGPGTTALAAAVCEAGGLGFVAGGYLTPDAFRDQIARVREQTARPFGVNLFVPNTAPGDPAAIERYVAELAPLAQSHDVALGAPVHDDDHDEGKLEVVFAQRPAVASFTFGLPSVDVIAALHAAGIEVWVTVTDRAEADAATSSGADAIVAQGTEAGGHQGSFTDHDRPRLPLTDLLAAVVPHCPVPVVATGGIMDGAGVRAALGAGATAAQLGTALLLCPEAGTSEAHRAAMGLGRPTTLTRAFTGRLARGIRNEWTDAFPDAPSAYPEVHHVTAPLRSHGRSVGDPEMLNLWAGLHHAEARAVPASEVVAGIAADLTD